MDFSLNKTNTVTKALELQEMSELDLKQIVEGIKFESKLKVKVDDLVQEISTISALERYIGED